MSKSFLFTPNPASLASFSFFERVSSSSTASISFCISIASKIKVLCSNSRCVGSVNSFILSSRFTFSTASELSDSMVSFSFAVNLLHKLFNLSLASLASLSSRADLSSSTSISSPKPNSLSLLCIASSLSSESSLTAKACVIAIF